MSHHGTHNAAANGKRIYRLNDLATIFDVDLSTVHRWVTLKKIPAPKRVGGLVFWPRRQIDNLIDGEVA